MVVETMHQEHLGYRETARQFELKGFHGIQRWERIYLEEGAQGLYEERRGRGSNGRPHKQMAKKTEEDLLAEVQRLRAENDYLKKLNALVLEEERQSKRRK
jgi:transposase